MMDIIELNSLEKSYGSIKALNGLNLKVPYGKLFGLLGPNGAGKSTALKIITTLLAPDKGDVFVGGVNAILNPTDVRDIIGYVAQEVALDKILTGRELLELHGDLYHLLKSDRDKKIIELVQELQMIDWIDRRTGSYSGGMKRRLDLACGLLHNPELLILDEPTVGLDLESRNTIWNLLKSLASQGKTILLSSHYLEEIDSLADEMAIIDSGKVIAQGSPEKLKNKLGGKRIILKVREFSNQEESEKLRMILQEIDGVDKIVINKRQGFSLNLVVERIEVLNELRASLMKLNYNIFSLSESQPSLDDVYLQATGRTIMDAEFELTGKRDFKKEAKSSMR